MSLGIKIKELVQQEALEVIGNFEKFQESVDEVVETLRKYDLSIDQRLILIQNLGRGRIIEEPAPTTAGVDLTEVLEPVLTKVDPRTAKAEKANEVLADYVLKYLNEDGPKTRRELMDTMRIPATSDFKLGKALQHLRKQNLVSTRTEEWQGPTLWYSFDNPVTREQLDFYIKGQPYGVIDQNIILKYLKLDRRSYDGVVQLLRSFVKLGKLTKREGLFYKEKPVGKLRDFKQSNGRKKDFAGGGIATSGDKCSSDKEVRALVTKIKEQGGLVYTEGKHIKIEFKHKTTTIGKTPGIQGIREDKANLRKLGLNI